MLPPPKLTLHGHLPYCIIVGGSKILSLTSLGNSPQLGVVFQSPFRACSFKEPTQSLQMIAS